MIHKAILFLTVCMSVWVLFLFYTTVRPIFFKKEEALFLPYDTVINVALLRSGKEELLNFEQQVQFLIQLNACKSLTINLKNSKDEPLFFEKIIIYRFNQENLNILPAVQPGSEKKPHGMICLNNLQ